MFTKLPGGGSAEGHGMAVPLEEPPRNRPVNRENRFVNVNMDCLSAMRSMEQMGTQCR
jgi:hypothetical protein